MSRLPIRIQTIAAALAASLLPRTRPTTVRRILLAHNLLLGDTMLLAPLLKKLRAQYPEAECVVLARPAFLLLFEQRPYGVTALAYDRHVPASQAAVLNSGPYDLALVPDDNRYAWLARAAGARWVIGFADDRPAWKNWMLDVAVPYPLRAPANAPLAMSTVPVWAAWADLATHLVDGPAPASYAPQEWPAPHARAFNKPPQPYAVLHVGASTPLKYWPSQRWRALADHLKARGCTIVWSGGKGEGALLASIQAQPDELDLIGQLDLAQLWALLADAQVLVCPDTGIAHLARIVGVPTVALFGPGSAMLHGPGIFWRDAPFTVVTEPDFPCRNQHVLYRRELDWVRRCGRRYGGAEVAGPTQCATPLCMQALTLDAVKHAVEQAIKRPENDLPTP